MKEISVDALRRDLDAALNAIAGGEEVVVTRHGRPVARLVPTCRGARRLPRMQALRDSIQPKGMPLSEYVLAERATAIDELLELRAETPPITEEQARAARAELRERYRAR